jgi:hypothetical protein
MANNALRTNRGRRRHGVDDVVDDLFLGNTGYWYCENAKDYPQHLLPQDFVGTVSPKLDKLSGVPLPTDSSCNTMTLSKSFAQAKEEPQILIDM